MKTKIPLWCWAILICLMLTACKVEGTMEMVQGRVVDAKTGQPVEGAAVAIHWIYEKFALPGLGSNDVDLGTTEVLTDAQGNFTIPRYIGRTHYMGAYKEGYVCWSSEDIFNPYGETHEEIFKKRSRHRVKDGMIIQLEPMPEYITTDQREQHACFTIDVRTRLTSIVPTLGARPFFAAVKHEAALCK